MPEMLLNQGKQIKAQFARAEACGRMEPAEERHATLGNSRVSSM